jgi:hypothetical protein
MFQRDPRKWWGEDPLELLGALYWNCSAPSYLLHHTLLQHPQKHRLSARAQISQFIQE